MTLSLKLFHGRNTPTEKLNDWGFDGPTLGPLDYVSLTYGVLQLCTRNECFDAPLIDGLIAYDGKFYGDASISVSSPTRPEQALDENRLTVPRALLEERSEQSPIRISVDDVQTFREISAVFVDAIRERLGDATADSAALALSNVVMRRSGARDATPERLSTVVNVREVSNAHLRDRE